jgi:glutamate/tyrosine decarboxylase-like PLP-dependent enzyme
MDAMDARVSKAMPQAGMSFDAIKSHLEPLELPDPYAHFARAFRGPKDVQEVGKYAFEKFMSDNGFFSMYLPYMQTIEQEVISMGVSLLNPEENSTGNFTSGGTESNFSAMHAARNWARVHKPQVGKPNVVAPYTIHPSLAGVLPLTLQPRSMTTRSWSPHLHHPGITPTLTRFRK